jgi:hypothetical protein
MTRADYRGRLQSQAAAALCRIHDFEIFGERMAWEPAPQVTFRFCPQCGGELHTAPDQWDSHSLQRVCNEQHAYTLHGDLYFELLGKPVEMDRELADVPLVGLCRSFSSRSGPWASAIHSEVAAVFDAFARRQRELWAREMKTLGFPT